MIKIGETYDRQYLVKNAFNGEQKMEQSFRGAVADGCTTVYLTRNFTGNDWSQWEQGTIYVGGAGSRRVDSKRRKVQGDSYSLIGPQKDSRNYMMDRNMDFKLPVDVVVELSKMSFCYVGSWYVVEMRKIIDEESGHSRTIFKLQNRVQYLAEMDRIPFQFPCKIRKYQISVFR